MLVRSAQLSVAGVFPIAIAACGDKGSKVKSEACADLDMLSQGELSLRKSAQYVEISEDSSTICDNCSYFSAVENSSCGQCQIFNGPANRAGHCISWNLRQA
jgi:hypothetical protein